MSADPMDRRRWHLDKSVSIGHILTTLSLFGALAYQYAAFSSRLAVLENSQTTVTVQLTQLLTSQHRVDSRQDSEIVEIKRDIRDTYRSIDQKIDTLISQRGQK